MYWARILAYVTGTVDQELLARNEYLAAENRSLADLPSEQNFGLLGAHAFDYVRRMGCEFVFDHARLLCSPSEFS